jgi:hypothetical protein
MQRWSCLGGTTTAGSGLRQCNGLLTTTCSALCRACATNKGWRMEPGQMPPMDDACACMLDSQTSCHLWSQQLLST